MSNCLAVDGITNVYGYKYGGNTATSRCILCKKGFNLSYDGKACV